MTEKGVDLRLYRPGDETGIVKLFREIFGREMTLEEWRWKYTGRVKKKVYSSVGVSESGEIVAHYGGMPQRMIYHGREVYGLSIGDIMVHMKFRGFKLFKKAAALVPGEAVRDGIILGYGFPAKRALALAEKLGLYEKVEDVYEGTKEPGFNNNINRFIYRFFPLNFEDTRIDSLWESVKKEMTLAVVRDGDYLRWRYQKHPFFHYELWGLKKRLGSRLQGLAVLRREEERMLVTDFLCRAKMLGALFEKIENYAYRLGKKTIILWFPEYIGPTLGERGFSLYPSATSIPRTTHESTLTKAEMKGNFFYTMGDTDFL